MKIIFSFNVRDDINPSKSMRENILIKTAKVAIFGLMATYAIPESRGAAVLLNDDLEIIAIGGILAEGVLYDVSFDGTFGTMTFLGNESGAREAVGGISSILDLFYASAMYPGIVGFVGNESGENEVNAHLNSPGGYYEITTQLFSANDVNFPDGRDFFFSAAAAGWTRSGGVITSTAGPSPSYVEVTFRESIPGAIPEFIPEPSTGLLLLSGIFLFGKFRSR